MTVLFMEDNHGHFMRIVRRKDQTVLVTASTNGGAKQSWEYPEKFDIDVFVNKMITMEFRIVEGIPK